MSTPIEKIEIVDEPVRYVNGFSVPNNSRIIANKINEIIDFCNNKALVLHLEYGHKYDERCACIECGKFKEILEMSGVSPTQQGEVQNPLKMKLYEEIEGCTGCKIV